MSAHDDAQGAGGITVRRRLTIEGGSLKAPVIVEPVMEDAEGNAYCKINKRAAWVSLFVTGVSVCKRPLAATKICDVAHDKLRQRALLGAMMQDNSVSSLQLDDEEDAPNHTKKWVRKRRRTSRLESDSVELELPTCPESTSMAQVTVLNKTLEDSVWLKCDEAHLTWLRNYIRAEINAAADDSDKAAQSAKDDLAGRSRPFWCSSASCWRVVVGLKVKNFYVARVPAESFAERSEAARAQAAKWLDDLVT